MRVLFALSGWLGRRSARFYLGGLVVAALGVALAATFLEPPRAQAADRLLSECWRTPGAGGGFTVESAVSREPTEDQKRRMGYDWLPDDVVPTGGRLVDGHFFHLLPGTDAAFLPYLETDNKDDRMAVDVKAEWGSESDTDAVLDDLKVARYQAGMEMVAGSGAVTGPKEGTAPLQSEVMTGAVTRSRPASYVSGSCTVDSHGQITGCTTSTSVTNVSATESYSGVGIELEHGGGDAIPEDPVTNKPLYTEGGSYTVTEADPDNRDVKFAEYIDQVSTDDADPNRGNTRLQALTSERMVDTAGDVLRVTIDLKGRHRRDVEYDGRVWPLFGEHRVGELDGLWPKQSFLWDDTVKSNAGSRFGIDRNGGVVARQSGHNFTVQQNAPGLLTGGEIRWPVYLSDMAWYLYRVPGVSKEHYLSQNSNELHDALVGDLNPNLVFKYDISAANVIWPETDIDWNTVPDKEEGDPYGGIDLDITGKVVMPFSSQNHNWPHKAELVKAGVASPADGAVDPANRGMNTFFQFDVVEHQAHGQMPRRGVAALGVGRQGHHWWNLSNSGGQWPNSEVDPNETHILVVTFYEGRQGDKMPLLSTAGEQLGKAVTVQYRRVICRVVVRPLGVGMGSDTEAGFWRQSLSLLREISPAIRNLPAAMISMGARSVMSGLDGVVEAAEKGGCTVVSQLSGDATGPEEVAVAYHGDDAVEGQAECEDAMANRTVSECVDGVPDSCREQLEPSVAMQPTNLVRLGAWPSNTNGVLPRKVDVYDGFGSLDQADRVCADFRPASPGIDGPGPQICYRYDAVRQAFRMGTGSAEYVAGCADGSCDSGSSPRFLPETRLTWEPSNGFDNSDHDGYIVRVRLDPEAVDLPFYKYQRDGEDFYDPADPELVGPGLVRDFYVPRYVPKKSGSGVVDVAEGGLTFGAGRDVDFVQGAGNLTASDGTDLYDLQQWSQNRMVLGHGFDHEVSFALYRGSLENDGINGLVKGPFSQPQALSGTDLACDHLDGLASRSSEQEAFWNALQCPGSSGAAATSSVVQDTLSSFQVFTGTEVCRDILTATPPHLTYDLPAVRKGWKIAWMVSMALVPALLFWEALRMSWGVWFGDERMGSAVRSLAPRLLLGIVLAAGSLLLCQLLIMLCAHLTCYVGHATDVTLWGVIGWAFVGMFEAGWGLVAGVAGSGAGAAGALALGFAGGPVKWAAVGIALFIILAVIFALVLLLVVQMALRILVIAVLTMLAPVALIMVLSPSTSGWAWRWLSMMLGTLFMQAVAVMVLFLGIELARSWDPTEGGGFGGFILRTLMSFVVFYLATKVPSVMNGLLANAMMGAVTEMRRSVQTAALLRMASQAGRFRP